MHQTTTTGRPLRYLIHETESSILLLVFSLDENRKPRFEFRKQAGKRRDRISVKLTDQRQWNNINLQASVETESRKNNQEQRAVVIARFRLVL